MTGKANNAPLFRRRLLAVTICINYADYLECVIENRRHFDRWIVMTVPGDLATHRLCERYGIQCQDSMLMQADGKDFNAVNKQGEVNNEGIERLLQNEADDEAWCVVVDADILLPRHFGERVRAMPLEAGRLYATYARKVCKTREQFELLRHCEPWERLPARNSQALGYFNLFSLAATPNKYLVRTNETVWEHDDYLFTTSFPVERRSLLPFTVLHLGEFGVDWYGRSSNRYETRNRLSGIPSPSTDGRDAGHDGKHGTAVTLGCFPSERLQEIAHTFSKVILVDEFRLYTRSSDPLVEADRVLLRKMLDEQLRNVKSLKTLDSHTIAAVALVPDGSVDLLYIAGEASPEALSTALPHWLPKLREGATIGGEAYGLPHFPNATYSLAMLIGTPEEVLPDGCWRKRYHSGERLLPKIGDKRPADGEGIVILSGETGSTETLLMSLYAARQHWSGPIELWHQGGEDGSLQIVCVRLRIAWVPICDRPVSAAAFINDAYLQAPFDRTLILLPGHFLIGKPLFAGGPNSQAKGERDPLLVTRTGDFLSVTSAASVAGNLYDGRTDTPLLLCEDVPVELSELAWEKWCDIELESTKFNVTEIRVAPRATVVTVVTPEDAGDFQRNWLTWRFRGTAVVIVLIDIAPEEYWLPGSDTARIIPASSSRAADSRWFLGMIADACETERVLFVSPHAAALPGAELWPDLPEDWSAVHYPEAARREEEITGNRFVPRNYFALVSRNDLQTLPDTFTEAILTNLPRLLIGWGIAKDARVGTMLFSDLEEMGWQFPAMSSWENGLGRMWAGCESLLRQREDGQLQLADRVVVISLPERTDRRERVAEMMEKENLWFRFVDGVRVGDAEIEPFEVAGVRRQNFKMVAGFEKYLRGMVGCRRAHLRELEAAQAAGLRSLLIIEDDMGFSGGWLEKFERAVSELPEGWMQLHLSASDFHPSRRISRTLRRLKGAYQTTAILYSEAGIAAALNCIRHSRSEIDHWMGNHLHPFGNSYVIEPRIAYQCGGVSDIMSFDRGTTA